MTYIPRQWIQVVDSHTGGEPTRLIYDGQHWPFAGSREGALTSQESPSPSVLSGLRKAIDGSSLILPKTMSERRQFLETEADWLRTASLLEPRGSDVLVGAILTPPEHASSQAGVVFCNNTGYLGMCGHGMIGVIVSLGQMGLIAPGPVTIDTPVGSIAATWSGSASVTLTNVWSYRYRQAVSFSVPGLGVVTGDIAWGGNWFFLIGEEVHQKSLDLGNLSDLLAYTSQIRSELGRQGIAGAQGAEIDHVELFAGCDSSVADSQNFVLCPGGAYDRSPCGTGTSAKLACLVADGKVAEGGLWRQKSIVGSCFQAKALSIREGERGLEVLPQLTGEAYVTGVSTLQIDEADPFRWGILPPQ